MQQKLVALLHLKLPPEIHLSKARASLLRVTFILDFGVPQIIIEVDGVQIHARLADETEPLDAKPRGKEPTPPRSQKTPPSPPPRRTSSPPPFADDASDISSEPDDEHIPTVDDLAQSFIREEPEEEIRELEEALNTQSEYLQESVSSSDDGDDDGTAGVGTPLGLPMMLRNALNTALDRLQIMASNIDIEVEDRFPSEPSTASGENEDPSVSLNFHIDCITIDSVTSQDPRVDIAASTPMEDPNSRLGKRRMRIENLYARLISDADNFTTMSRISRPPSPVDTRSEISSIQKSRSETSVSQASANLDSSAVLPQTASSLQGSQASRHSVPDEIDSSPTQSHHEPARLSSSILTTDEDRFADVASDDGQLDQSLTSDSLGQSAHSETRHAMTASSILYDDEGLLDYALQNEMFSSRAGDAPGSQLFPENSGLWGGDGANLGHELEDPFVEHEVSATSGILSSSLERSSNAPSETHPLVQSQVSEQISHSTDNLVSARQHATEESPEPPENTSSSSPSRPPNTQDDLSESKIFTHDDAESMYMSAMSAAPAASSHHPTIPGGWDSSSTSSQDTGSDTSAPIPPAMVAGSILGPMPEADDGCETPRPQSRHSVISSPLGQQRASQPLNDAPVEAKVAKLFLTVDQVTIWFPLDLNEDQPSEQTSHQMTEQPELSFSPPNLGEDSIFQTMPGSFSNYAYSTSSRRKGSIDPSETMKKRPHMKPAAPAEPLKSPKTKPEASANISIEVGSVLGHVDLSTGRIMFQLIDRVLKALTGPYEPEKKQFKAQEPATASPTSVELFIKHVGIAWLERLMTESLVGSGAPRPHLELNPLDSIFKVSLSSIHVVGQLKAEEARSKLLVGKFVLSSLDQDIISFLTPRSKSRRSVSSSAELLNNDIEVDFERSKDTRITVVTRPVKVMFDMQKLDEALSSFGGFSGVLELGNSISSSNALHSPAVSVAPSKPRGVHFGDAPPPVPAASSPNTAKIHVQFGEVTLVLKGKSCTVQLQTTSVRAAVRDSNVRLKISEVQLSGPYVDASQVGPPLIVEVKGTTINFLFTPEEQDLTRLISMITPSKDPYENNEDILIDTLLRQRRKGSVLRAEVTSVAVRVSDLGQLKTFEALGAEIAKLSKVTKYLPDDDRPGILTLAMVQHFDASVMVNDKIGDISALLQDASLAHVGVPSLLAVEVGKINISRGEEMLIREVVKFRQQDQLPMIMARIVGDEMEPVVKAKLFNLCAEYHVTTVMAALGLSEDGTSDEIALGLASSVATITGAASPKPLSRQTSESSSSPTTPSKPLHIDLLLRSCALGLNPRKLPSKGLFVLTDARFLGKQATKDEYSIAVELRKASIHAIDDTSQISDREVPSSSTAISSLGHRQLLELREYGYVSLSSISAAKVQVNIVGDGQDRPQIVNVEFKNELFVLESCADSTQTLIAILGGLQPPSPPSTAVKYRTVVPLQEMMESFTGDAVAAPDPADDENFMDNADLVADEVPTNLEFVGSLYSESLPTEEDLGDSMLGEEDLGVLATPPMTRKRGDQPLLESFQEQYEVAEGEQDFDFDDNYFKDSDSDHKGKARKWDSTKNQYHLTNEFKTPDAPLKVRVRDVNIVWNLYDGYDWPRTRGIITQAVEDVEARAEERRQRPREEEEEDDFVEQDFLFNSVWIGVPIKDEKGALARRINHDIDDLASETGSYATSTATRSTGATVRPRSATKSHRRKLKLERSKNKKIAFELSGVAVDLIVFPPNTGETQSSVNMRVRDFDIYDHVPTSTWKKFVTSLIDPSQREMARPMIDLEILTVKPVTELAASELVIRATVLPLRLHVDQDALDFITRFFEFKDDSAPENTNPSEQPFIQRLEVMAVTIKLDYKPKRVDYRGLRSGHTTEFMNFLILDGADIVLRHAIVYGITSFDKLHKTLNDVWMPDVKRNQLPGVLSGLAAVRPIVNVGSGVRDLVVVPMREYKKDGRIVRSLQKGVYAFAKNTTSEVARLGAKVAIGTQNLLEGAENFLNPQSSSPRSPALHEWDDLDAADASDDEPRAVSNYANQPIGVKAGLRSAARYLERDLLTARDAVIAIPAEVMEEGTGVGMAKAIARRAPTVILRPALGATKAVSNTLLGVGNALDADSRRKIEDVSRPSTLRPYTVR